MTMQDFLETPRFDTEISYGSSGGPGFNNYVFTTQAGREGVTTKWDQARAQYNVVQSIRDAADMDVIRQLFYVCRGRAVGFRFKDWQDYTFTEEYQGVGDGVTRTFNLIKTYGAGTTHEYVRRLFKPVDSTVTVYADGVLVGASNYSIDTTTGIITFTALATPADGVIITASGEFDVPVRFDMDDLAVEHGEFDLQSISRIGLTEIKFED